MVEVKGNVELRLELLPDVAGLWFRHLKFELFIEPVIKVCACLPVLAQKVDLDVVLVRLSSFKNALAILAEDLRSLGYKELVVLL